MEKNTGNHFEKMESAFGVGKEMSEKEKEQFERMQSIDELQKASLKMEKVPGTETVDKSRKEAGKDAVEYYKDTVKKMEEFQKPDQEQQEQSRIGESLQDIPKVDREMSDEENTYEAEAYGSGMQGLKYDDEGSEKHKQMEDRMDDLHDEDPTYKKLKDAGQDYKDHKYGEKEYGNSPKIRVESKVMEIYTDVLKENIFKTKGEIKNEEQVLKVANKVPSRVKVDETVFAITDGENTYRLMWEGEEPVITHIKNQQQVNESIDKMKHLWNFDSKDTVSTKKNITESGEDAFKRMYDKLKGTDGLVG